MLVVAAARSTNLDTEVGVGATIFSRWAAAATGAEAVARVARQLTVEEFVEGIAQQWELVCCCDQQNAMLGQGRCLEIE
jgi:hypothetical protein